jgi:hypothetical protein
VALQKAQATTILHQPVVAGGEREASSKLGVLRGFSLISLQDLLHATSDGFRTKVLCFLLLQDLLHATSDGFRTKVLCFLLLQDLLLHATSDGFRTEVLCFLLLGLPIEGSALFECGLLLGLQSFLFSSFVGLLVFFI